MRTEKFHNKGLSYYCHQKLEDFTTNEKGYFCQQCAKNLIDFRDKTKREYEQIAKENGQACGIFYADQVGDEIELNINWKKPLMVFSLISFFMFSRTGVAQEPKANTLEQVDTPSDNTVGQPVEEKNTEVKNDESCKALIKHKRKMGRRRLYVSKRFPFLHYDRKRNYIAGRFWH